MGRQHILLGGGGTLAATLALIILVTPGCDSDSPDGYEMTAIYPPRKDLLVIDAGKATPPTELFAVGKLEVSIGDIGSRGGILLSPSKVTAAEQKEITAALMELFGSPAKPVVGVPEAAEHGLIAESLAAGSRVFKKRCIDCHGMSGDGRGPTSLWVYPPARDFRQAQFKFVSTGNGLGWPTRADLHRVIRRGIGGNSMPPFVMLSDAEIDDVASYVLHLTFRGRVEYELLKAFASDDPPKNAKDQAVKELAKWYGQWRDSQRSELKPVVPAIEPRDAGLDTGYDDSVRTGHSLFISETVGCAKCHVDYGRASAWRYDVYGVTVKPPDLTRGLPRAGREPLDYYHRIRAGIAPSGMPAISTLDETQLWDIVTFLKALPDPRHLPRDVRETIYSDLPSARP